MFRAAPNEFDELVAKATDENLTAENWELILNVCDKVQENPSSNSQEVVAAIIKRLSHRNANVQLYSLELANALVQNCGEPIHRELASRSFTDKLLTMATDRTTHAQVKARIQERMEEWVKEFESNPDLGIMAQAFQSLRSKNPHIPPPSRPQKTEISAADRRREEEELAMALALSIQESQKSKPAGPSSQSQAQRRESSSYQQQEQPKRQQEQHQEEQKAELPAVTPGSTAATVSRVRALYDFQPTEAGELQFARGDIITVLESVYNDWWRGSLRGKIGIFPLNYVEKLADPTRDELEREAQMEAEVFGEMRNVEKLLALLSTNTGLHPGGIQDNDEVSQLYHSTLAIRPKLIELIGKYSQKKEEFTQLNEKFIKARREYENLLEASMSQPSGGYGRTQYGGYGHQHPSGTPNQPYAPSQPHNLNSTYPSHPAPFHILSADQQHRVASQQHGSSGALHQPPLQHPQDPQPTGHGQANVPESQPYAQSPHKGPAVPLDGAHSSPYSTPAAPLGGSATGLPLGADQANSSSYDFQAGAVQELAGGRLGNSHGTQPSYPPGPAPGPVAGPGHSSHHTASHLQQQHYGPRTGGSPVGGFPSGHEHAPSPPSLQPQQQKPSYSAYRPPSSTGPGPSGYGGVPTVLSAIQPGAGAAGSSGGGGGGGGGRSSGAGSSSYGGPPYSPSTRPASLGPGKIDEVESFYR